MKITNIRYSTHKNKSRLSADLVLDSGKQHEMYFEVDKEFEGFMAKDASPFLAAALAISMKQNESLQVGGAVSKRLMAATPQIMKVLHSWKIGFNPILVNATDIKEDTDKPNSVGCFFSGGVDSFYTYLKNKSQIDYLIFVHGFDIKLKDTDLYDKVEKNIIKIANKENVKLIKVNTNIRETFEQYFDWDMSHVFGLGSVSLFLRGGLKEIFMSCGQTDLKAKHLYMSPDLDRLWSTEIMKTHHFGCPADKIRKLKYLSKFKIVMETLRVCWVNVKGQYNCCECEKCFRNMLALYASNSLEKCKTFKKKLDLDKLENIRLGVYVLKYFIAVLKTLKRNNNTSNVRFALEKCIQNNQNPSFQQKFGRSIRDSIGYVDKKYNRNRLFWYLSTRGFI